jgi:ferredoxin
MRKRHRDGSGRGALLGASATGTLRSEPAVAVASEPDAVVPASPPGVVHRVRIVAVVTSPGSCIACGTCVETCPRNAIALAAVAVVDASVCTGCGLCVSDCAYGALTLAEV